VRLTEEELAEMRARYELGKRIFDDTDFDSDRRELFAEVNALKAERDDLKDLVGVLQADRLTVDKLETIAGRIGTVNAVLAERRGWERCREAAAQLVLDRSVASVRAVETAAAIRKLEPTATGTVPPEAKGGKL
jgi:hypothetical protein